MTPLIFHIPGTPKRWQRTRDDEGKRRTPKEMIEAKQRVAAYGNTAVMQWQREHGAWPLEAAYEVEISYIRSRSRIQTPDIDNYEKLVLDSLNGIVWKDDARVVKVTHEKLDARVLDTDERTEVWVWIADELEASPL